MDKMLNSNLSVIIPYFNALKSIKNTVNSVIEQQGNFFFEIIIVDDASDVILSFDNLEIKNSGINYEIIILRNEVNMGVGLSRTRGINFSKFNQIAFLDSDDSWLPNKTITQINYLNSDSDISLVGSLTNMPSRNIPFYRKKDKIFYQIKKSDFLFQWYFQPSTIIIKKSFLDLIDFDIYRYGGEGWYYIQLSKFSKLILINKQLVNYNDGKRGFGKSGLTSKITYNELCELRNFFYALFKGYFNFFLFLFAIIFSIIKYFRRLLISILDRIN